ncbi:hypothetical protein AB9M62_57310 [Bacillales bacterium AN1005]
MKRGAVMPLIDNYLIDNSLIDGPRVGSQQQTVTPHFGNTETTVSARSTPELRTLVTFPAGTTLIAGGSDSGSSSTLLSFVGGTINSINYGLVLMDKSGNQHYLAQTWSGYIHLAYLMINLINKKVNILWVYSGNGDTNMNGASTKYNHLTALPESFDVTGDIRLVYKIITNAHDSSSSAYSRMTNFTFNWK